MASESTPHHVGRPARRHRTRAAILDATVQLLRDGHTPALDEITAAAEVSRRTIYMHFPTLDQLILDASMGALAGSDIEAEFEPDTEAAERVATIVDTLYDHAEEWLPLGRRMVALTATNPPADGPKRGHGESTGLSEQSNRYANASATSSTTASCHRSPSSWDGRQ